MRRRFFSTYPLDCGGDDGETLLQVVVESQTFVSNLKRFQSMSWYYNVQGTAIYITRLG